MGALLCSLVALTLAGHGGKAMETTLQDDALLLHRPAAQVRRTARQIADLGADRVRITAGWAALSPSPRSRRVPGAPFDASDSATYPRGSWDALDTAVRAADDAGLGVQLDLGFWAPRWAVRRASANGRERWWPDAALFADFATAVARRYSGGFPDPVDRGRPLPAVRMFTPWNEPNHPSFLAPQWARAGRGRGWRPESPHVYRAMYEAAYDAIKRVSPLDLVLMGGTASTGSAVPGRGGVPPLAFLRAMACVDDRLEPLAVPECRGFRPLRADGYAHHPYSRLVAPAASDPLAGDVPIADTARLSSLLGELALRGRVVGKLPIYDTEYGYESREDDPFAPFSRDDQARFLGWSSFLAWSDPDTVMFAQFLLRDVDPKESGRPPGTRGYYRDWQTGLLDAAGDPKPAARAFKLPFWAQEAPNPEAPATPGAPAGQGASAGPAGPNGQTGAGTLGRAILVWGQVRPSHGEETVRVERQDSRTGGWSTVPTSGSTCDDTGAAFLTDATGTFLRALPPSTDAATYRFSWRHRDGSWEPSMPVTVQPPTT